MALQGKDMVLPQDNKVLQGKDKASLFGSKELRGKDKGMVLLFGSKGLQGKHMEPVGKGKLCRSKMSNMMPC